MAFNLSTFWDVSYLATFLGGTAVGCAGQYFADKFTDQRRDKKSASELNKRFSRLQENMKDLMTEMSEDLRNNDDLATREFVILSNTQIIFNSSVKRFAYLESKHPNILNQVAMLVDAGFLNRVAGINAPVYRFREEFVELLVKLKS